MNNRHNLALERRPVPLGLEPHLQAVVRVRWLVLLIEPACKAVDQSRATHPISARITNHDPAVREAAAETEVMQLRWGIWPAWSDGWMDGWMDGGMYK